MSPSQASISVFHHHLRSPKSRDPKELESDEFDLVPRIAAMGAIVLPMIQKSDDGGEKERAAIAAMRRSQGPPPAIAATEANNLNAFIFLMCHKRTSPNVRGNIGILCRLVKI